jgi:hypothetical protein
MRVIHLLENRNNYLYEGLENAELRSIKLWESAGYTIREAALSADQIQNLFKEIETQATAAGGNRTMLGKGKDAAGAVNKAWEDLKTKVQDSGPIKAVDQKYDDVVAKIEKGLGGPDNAVSKVIMGYRKFAKEHPIAQGLIYSALIAAAGISGAGLGGAAVLGLLKMTDKLLQGEKFSSAAYSGAKTGAMAYGASKVGDYIKGKMGEPPAAGDVKPGGGEVPADIQKGLAADQAFQDRILNKFPPDKGYTFNASGKSLQVLDANGTKVFTGDIPLKTMDVKTFADLTNNGQMATPGISSGSISSDAMAGVSDTAKAAGKGAVDASTDIASKAADVATSAAKPYGANMDPDLLQRVVDAGGKSGVRFKISPEDAAKALDWQAQNGGQAVQAATDTAGKAASGYSKEYLEKVLSGDTPRPMISKEKAAALLKNMEGVVITTKPLSEGQVYLVFNRVCALNNNVISEGPMDALKGLAGKAMDKARTIGTNLTTKITADKLNSAWQKAGAPTDSEELKNFLTSQKVDAAIVDTVYKSLKIKSGVAATPAADSDSPAATSLYAQVKTDLAKLDKKGKQRLAAYLQKQLGTT